MSVPILYNLTLKLEKSIKDDFIVLIKESIFDSIIQQGIVKDVQLNRIVTEEQEEDAFSIHFSFPDSTIYENKRLEVFGLFLRLMDEKFRAKYVYFGTTMEVLDFKSTK